jgi:hypothetical protein
MNKSRTGGARLIVSRERAAARLRQSAIGVMPPPIRQRVRELLVWRRHAGIDRADLLIASYPKSGNTWARFVIAQALVGREIDFDSVRRFSPYIGRQRTAPNVFPEGGRLIKTHEVYRRYSARCPAVYLIRDGRDVCLSYYFMMKRLSLYHGDLGPFVDDFLRGRIGSYGSWQEHVASWEKARSARPGEVVFVRYEDMLGDATEALYLAFRSVGRSLSREALAAAVQANSFTSMRSKEATSDFLARRNVDTNIPVVRDGRAGQWRAAFDSDMKIKFDEAAGAALRAAGYQ